MNTLEKLFRGVAAFRIAYRSPVPGFYGSYPLDRDPCAECTKKHASTALLYLQTLVRWGVPFDAVKSDRVYPFRHLCQAVVLAAEVGNGYPRFKDYVTGHLVCAEEEYMRLGDTEKASKVREARRQFNDGGSVGVLTDLLLLEAEHAPAEFSYAVGHALECASELYAAPETRETVARDLALGAILFAEGVIPAVDLAKTLMNAMAAVDNALNF